MVRAQHVGQSAANRARLGDESARLSLMEAISNGMGSEDAAVAAAGRMDANLASARDQANEYELGDMFANVDLLNAQSAQAQAQREYLAKRGNYALAAGFNGTIG
jgi:hypothetical protein